ncbi:MAG: magnesium transporter [Candidatus Omnitrophota bacterium]|jgi:magnesium transporter
MVKSQNRKFEVFALFLPEIKEFIIQKDFATLKDFLRKINSIDMAEGWRRMDNQEKILIFKLLSPRKAVEVFEDLHFEEQSFLMRNLNCEDVSQVLNEMAPDERTKLFKDLSPAVMKKFLSIMKSEEAKNVQELLTFPEDTAGSIMTTDIVETRKNMTARKALLTLQENLTMSHAKDIHSAYVTDDNHILIGKVSVQTLLKAPQDMLVKDIMSSGDEAKIEADLDKTEVAKRFSKYDLLDAPVIDRTGRLIGMITIDDVVDLIERQATSDLYEIGKMDPAEGTIISYQKTSVKELFQRRAGWLILLLIFDFLTGTVLKTFEHTLSAVVALTFFIPMLLDTGGNAGAQTSITIIRGMATGDVTFKNMWKVVRLEVITAFLMALVVGTVALGRAFLLQKEFMVSAVVGLTMFLIVIVSILTGIALPLASKKFGLDPACLAGPITTSVVDVAGLIIYFKIAQLFIPALRF